MKINVNTPITIDALKDLGFCKHKLFDEEIYEGTLAGVNLHIIENGTNCPDKPWDIQIDDELFESLGGGPANTFGDLQNLLRHIAGEESAAITPVYNAGDYLVALDGTNHVFIFDGNITADGYGAVIGDTEEGVRCSTGKGNFCKGCLVRRAFDGEIESFVQKLYRSNIENY